MGYNGLQARLKLAFGYGVVSLLFAEEANHFFYYLYKILQYVNRAKNCRDIKYHFHYITTLYLWFLTSGAPLSISIPIISHSTMLFNNIVL